MVVLSVALLCALVAIGFLVRRGTAAGGSTDRTGTAPLGPGDVVAPEPPAASASPPASDALWTSFAAPTDVAGAERLLVRPWPVELASPSGRRLPAGAPLARAVQEVLQTRVPTGALDSAVSVGADLFFRFEANPAMLEGLTRGLYEVMPSTRGGFRSVIRDVASKEIVGHGSYVPTLGITATARQTAVKAAKFGPAVWVAGIAGALDMAADAEQRRRLESIHRVAAAVRDEQVRQQIASLVGAAKRLDAAGRSVLDTGFVPTALGIDSAAATISTAWERSARKLEEWQSWLTNLPERVDLGGLKRAFPGITDLEAGEFWAEVALCRASQALHTRATLLAAAEAAAHNPGHPYQAFRSGLDAQLQELEAGGDHLRDFMRDLANREIALGGLVSSGTANQATALTRRLMRLAEELAHPEPVDTLPLAIGPLGNLQLEGAAHADGSLTLLSPDRSGRSLHDSALLRTASVLQHADAVSPERA